jgi:hypothetical protein
MALTLSAAARNARLSAIITELGASPILRVRTGAAPATVATASSGTVLATCALPSSPFGSPSAGVVAKSGTWEDTSADNTGTAGHFELVKADTTTVVIRGSVTAGGGGGDMTVDNTSFVATQAFTVTSFALTDANA